MAFASLFGVSLSLSFNPTPLLTTITLWLFLPPAPPPPPLLVFLHPFLLSVAFRLLCAHCRLALDDAIRHKQLNISRFSPRVAGENDFLQTVINKVITAKEVNHKGQGTLQSSDAGAKDQDTSRCSTVKPLAIKCLLII